MVKTESTMLPLGTRAPDFELVDTISGNLKTLRELKSPVATVIAFICNHCPFVQHINAELVRVANEFQAQGIRFIGISSNDIVNFPQDSPVHMKATAAEWGYNFPYLFDETQNVAKAYHAACTPDFYVFDAELLCIYRGQFDDSRPGNGVPVTGRDLRAALQATLAHQPINPDQKPSLGCNIKWKS